MRFVAICLMLVCSTTNSQALDWTALMKLYEYAPRKTPCWLARQGVEYAGSLENAVGMALQRGHSQADINYMIRRCRLSK